MVVDILETKLDDDYIDYIASMILKNATSSDDCAQNLTTQEVPAVPELPEIKKTNCLTEVKQERNKDLPPNWTYMDKKTVSQKKKKIIYAPLLSYTFWMFVITFR
jgi:hypothetical protein